MCQGRLRKCVRCGYNRAEVNECGDDCRSIQMRVVTYTPHSHKDCLSCRLIKNLEADAQRALHRAETELDNAQTKFNANPTGPNDWFLDECRRLVSEVKVDIRNERNRLASELRVDPWWDGE